VVAESVDQLIEGIAAIQALKAALEKQEAQLKTQLEKRLTDQQERLKKIGVAPAVKDAIIPPLDVPTAPGVSR
jgi:hypothetical protein